MNHQSINAAVRVVDTSNWKRGEVQLTAQSCPHNDGLSVVSRPQQQADVTLTSQRELCLSCSWNPPLRRGGLTHELGQHHQDVVQG